MTAARLTSALALVVVLALGAGSSLAQQANHLININISFSGNTPVFAPNNTSGSCPVQIYTSSGGGLNNINVSQCNGGTTLYFTITGQPNYTWRDQSGNSGPATIDLSQCGPGGRAGRLNTVVSGQTLNFTLQIPNSAFCAYFTLTAFNGNGLPVAIDPVVSNRPSMHHGPLLPIIIVAAVLAVLVLLAVVVVIRDARRKRAAGAASPRRPRPNRNRHDPRGSRPQ
jgi:hypothetical protein